MLYGEPADKIQPPADDANSLMLYKLIYAKAERYLNPADHTMIKSLEDFKKAMSVKREGHTDEAHPFLEGMRQQYEFLINTPEEFREVFRDH